jgi:CRISPR-associated protein Csm2
MTSSGMSPREANRGHDTLLNLVAVFKKGDSGKAELIAMAEECAKTMPPKVKTHQLRNLLSLAIKVRQSHQATRNALLSDDSHGKLAVMRPRVAYMAARTEDLRSLQRQFDELLRDASAFKKGEDVQRLYEFVEAIVAFHKYYNPKNDK